MGDLEIMIHKERRMNGNYYGGNQRGELKRCLNGIHVVLEFTE